MRFIQTGILLFLMAITGLLFAIYRRQAAPSPALDPVAEQSEAIQAEPLGPLEAVEVEAMEAPAPQAEEAAPERPKPRPVVSSAFAAPAPQPKPEQTEQPEPEAVPEPKQAASELAATPEPEVTIVGGEEPAEPPSEAPLEPTLEPEEPEAVADEASRFAEPLLEEPPAEPREPRVVTIPAGERLTVRIDNTLSTSRNRADDTFFATLEEPVIVDGLIIADKGARLQGRIVESQQAGRVKGLARLVCELTHLDTDDGQRVEIRTSVFALDGPRSRGEDMKRVAMGAGAGAILGAIFGGGKGAAIGAASGAGAGAGTAAATRGEPAVIEPETRLDFRLTDGVTITEKL